MNGISNEENTQSPSEPKEMFLQSIITKGKKTFGLNQINKVVTAVKAEIMRVLHPNREEQQSGREDE